MPNAWVPWRQSRCHGPETGQGKRGRFQDDARQSAQFLLPACLPAPPEIVVLSLAVASRAASIRTFIRFMQLKNRAAPAQEWPDWVFLAFSGSACLNLYSQAFAALGAACSNHGATTTRFHAGEETVRTCALDFGGLVCAFHDLSSYLYNKLSTY